ncbi:SseB family protein [Brevundimonas sp. LjRoot202]|uniref:SseB family protein n=1 Tax=Brevundimonas sp. LjRoot202 TaxID=3342281 RepID=UPI003ECE7141
MQTPPPEEAGAALEAAIIAAQDGGSLDELASAFMNSYVVVMLAEDPGPDPQALSPLTVSTPQGYLALVVFTTAGKCSNWSRNAPQYPHALLVRADWILNVVGDEYGIAVNPGEAVGFSMPPFGVAQMKARGVPAGRSR